MASILESEKLSTAITVENTARYPSKEDMLMIYIIFLFKVPRVRSTGLLLPHTYTGQGREGLAFIWVTLLTILCGCSTVDPEQLAV